MHVTVGLSHSSLRPRGLQHARLPCPLPTPGAYSNSCPSSWWCHPTISSSVLKSVNPKGNQSWIFIGKTDAEAPILWPPDAKNWLIGKDPDAGKDWRQKEKWMTEIITGEDRSMFVCIDHLGRLSYLSSLFFGTLHSNGGIFPFLLCLSLHFFSQLFVRPP